MAIKLTEARLRQIIREEVGRLEEMGGYDRFLDREIERHMGDDSDYESPKTSKRPLPRYEHTPELVDSMFDRFAKDPGAPHALRRGRDDIEYWLQKQEDLQGKNISWSWLAGQILKRVRS
jgi:hypothetical protein